MLEAKQKELEGACDASAGAFPGAGGPGGCASTADSFPGAGTSASPGAPLPPSDAGLGGPRDEDVD
jgi:hypothetical protein